MKKTMTLLAMMVFCSLWLATGCTNGRDSNTGLAIAPLPQQPGVQNGMQTGAQPGGQPGVQTVVQPVVQPVVQTVLQPVVLPPASSESKSAESENNTQKEMAKVEVATEISYTHVTLASPANSADMDAALLLSKIKFLGIKNTEVRCEKDGHIYIDVLMAYHNYAGKPVTVSEMISRALLIDGRITKPVLDTYGYADFCDITKPGCIIRDFYKKYDCGYYVPKQNEKRLSQIFMPGYNEEYMTFDFGLVVDWKLQKSACARLRPDGYGMNTQLMLIGSTVHRLFDLFNNLNGPSKNLAKFVFLGDGVANYNGPNGTIVLGKCYIAAVLPRMPIRHIFTAIQQ